MVSRFSRIIVLFATVVIVMQAQAESQQDSSTGQPMTLPSESPPTVSPFEGGYMAGYAAAQASCTVCSVPVPEAVNFMYHVNQIARCNQTTGTAPTTPAQAETSPANEMCSSEMAMTCVDEFVQMGGCDEIYDFPLSHIDCDDFFECAVQRCCSSAVSPEAVACVDGFVQMGGCAVMTER